MKSFKFLTIFIIIFFHFGKINAEQIAYINMEYVRIVLLISCCAWIILNLEGVVTNTYNYLVDFPLNQAMFGPPRQTFDDELIETKDD